MNDTITKASHEYANRPADERYPSLSALVDVATQDKQLSVERAYNLGDLRAVAEDGTLRLSSSRGTADFSHWSFHQLSRLVGAPAGYLREGLSPELAADCLNHGLQSQAGNDVVLLAKAANGKPRPIIRAATSGSYGRVWDADLYSAFEDTLTKHDNQWSLPPTWSGEPAGAYRGDRDSFVILTNGGSIVTDPSAAQHGSGPDQDSQAMYRGVMVRNSEVGAASVTIETVLYRYICGNHILWGATVDKSFRRRHVGKQALRDTMREVYRIARQWSERPESADQAIISGLVSHEIATTKASVVAELAKLGATKTQAAAAYDRAEQTESNPRSWWGASQGLTRISQDQLNQDDRYQLDRIAAAVMARGVKVCA